MLGASFRESVDARRLLPTLELSRDAMLVEPVNSSGRVSGFGRFGGHVAGKREQSEAAAM